jgi:hypothetical protein
VRACVVILNLRKASNNEARAKTGRAQTIAPQLLRVLSRIAIKS